MDITLYQVDAFADRVFAGNPAAICPLDSWLPDQTMQAIAAENNLSETAFFVPKGEDFDLRWFTPAVEVDLCGHATLASAYVIFTALDATRREVRFHTRSGVLTVARDGDSLVMDFPAQPPEDCDLPANLTEALGRAPIGCLATDFHYVAVFGAESDIVALDPDMAALMALDRFAVIATALGDQVDFVSRYFAPQRGIPEDPVTGSAHCVLTPYWARRLDKAELTARQVSRRGGALRCALDGDRVRIGGKAVPFMRGTITL